MKLFVLLTLSAVVAAGQSTSGTAAAEPEAYQAPISCTASVQARVCKSATDEFSILQQGSKVFAQVEIVIADSESFKKENDRVELAMTAN
jgi:hypothetical protein